VDPEVYLFRSHGVDLIRAEEPTKITACERNSEDAAPAGDFLARNLELNYGKDWHPTWTGLLMRRLPTWGYNTIGGRIKQEACEQDAT
jgi:hypothetical protein